MILCIKQKQESRILLRIWDLLHYVPNVLHKTKKKNPFVLAFTISAMSISETPLSGDSKLNVSKDKFFNLKKMAESL